MFTRYTVVVSMLKNASAIIVNVETTRYNVMKYWKLKSVFSGTCVGTFCFTCLLLIGVLATCTANATVLGCVLVVFGRAVYKLVIRCSQTMLHDSETILDSTDIIQMCC